MQSTEYGVPMMLLYQFWRDQLYLWMMINLSLIRMDRFTYMSLCLFQTRSKSKTKTLTRLSRSQAFWPIVYSIFINWPSHLASFSRVLLVGTCLRPKKGMQILTFLSWHFCERSSRQRIEISWANSLAPSIPGSGDKDLIWHCVECAVTPYSIQYGVEVNPPYYGAPYRWLVLQ